MTHECSTLIVERIIFNCRKIFFEKFKNLVKSSRKEEIK